MGTERVRGSAVRGPHDLGADPGHRGLRRRGSRSGRRGGLGRQGLHERQATVLKPIDKATWQRCQAAWRSSRRLAADFYEYLNQVGLLLTPARRAEILASELRKAAHELENASAVSIIIGDGRSGYSALDMQRATVHWLRQRADKIEKEG